MFNYSYSICLNTVSLSGFSSRESTEKKASVLRPRVRVGDYIYLQYKAYCMRYKFGKKNTCNTFLYRCFLLWFNCRYNLFCEEINMFFNCGNSACPLLQFDKQQVYVEKRGDDWDNGRENKISQQEITTIKIDLSKTMHQKNIVALLVVKNHYSRSPCSRLFGNQGEVQDEDFHDIIRLQTPVSTNAWWTLASLFWGWDFFFPFFSNQIYHTGMCAYMSTE